ncbi:hypothetical protein [Kosakonia sacchari]|uniref:hypothetical protein n=1 Tax=Kosakonia sacchari TaxID=1158459 RepID=UPI001585851E|nr:hypothetical protein [Kosakonia sacchari]NUL35073.1 hypothetical protein [Kosakonia sacchari]
MQLNDRAAQLALANGGFLLAGDYSQVISRGDVINVTGRAGVIVKDAKKMALIDAPTNLIMALCRSTNDGFMPFYSDMQYRMPHQAAMAQMLNDAVEGFDIDDLIDIDSLDSDITVVTVDKRIHTV